MVGFCLSWQWRTRHTVSSPTCGTSSSGQCPAPEPGLTCWHPGKGDIPAGLGAAAALLCCSIPPPLHPSIPAFPPSPLTLCTGWPHSLGASLSCSAEFRGERSSRIAARVAPAHLQAAFGLSGPSPVPDLTRSSKTSPCPGVSLWGLGDGWSLLKEVSLLWGRGRLRPLGLLEREHWIPPQFGCKVNSAQMICLLLAELCGAAKVQGAKAPRLAGWGSPWVGVLQPHVLCVPKHK